MKQVFKNVMVICAALTLGSNFTSCSKDDTSTNNAATTYSISGNANGSQVVPSVAGTGTGTMTGTYNASTGVLNYTTGWNGLTGAPTSGGFYTGASGTAGTPVGSAWNMGTGLSSTGTYSGSMTLTADQASQLRSGNWYYSMGTAAHTGGEVRGQMSATQNQ